MPAGPPSSWSCPPVCGREPSRPTSCHPNTDHSAKRSVAWFIEGQPGSYGELLQQRMSFDLSASVHLRSRVTRLVRLVWFQVVLVSVIGTLSRGVVNALNAVGAFGTGDVNTAIAVNIISSMTFSCLSWLSGAVVNVIGCSAGCFIGGCTTTFLLTSLMGVSILGILPSWVVWLAAAFDGVGSGVLWTSIGAVTIKYPDQNRKGFASTILFSIFSTGAALGGLVSFAMNASGGPEPADAPRAVVPTVARSRISSVMIMSPSVEDNLPIATSSGAGIQAGSYAAMIGIAASSIILSWLVLPEALVRHSDGRPVNYGEEDELALLPRNLSRPSRMSSSFRLFSEMLSPTRFRAGQSFDRGAEESERERSLASMAAPISAVVTTYGMASPQCRATNPSTFPGGWSKELAQLLDALQERSVQFLIFFSFASLFHQTYLFNGINYSTFNVRSRGLNCFMYWLGRIPAGFIHGYVVDDLRLSSRTRAFVALSILVSHMLVAQLLTLFFWGKTVDDNLDFATSPALTAHAFTAFFLYGGLDTISQSFAMWLFSLLGKDRPWRIPHYVAIYRTFQGFGVAFAWALDLNSFSSYQTQFVVCVLFWILALPGLTRMIYDLPSKDYLTQDLSLQSRCPACDRALITTTTGAEGDPGDSGFLEKTAQLHAVKESHPTPGNPKT